jgi:hypothetical protein
MYQSARDEAFRLRKFLSLQSDNLSRLHLYEAKQLMDKANGLSRRLNETKPQSQIRYSEIEWFCDESRVILTEAGCKHRECKRVMRELDDLASAMNAMAEVETHAIRFE